jgi:uncharacterized protein (TIGR03067 family)
MKFFALAVLSLVFLAGGCARRDTEKAPDKEKPPDTAFSNDLQTLQGTWRPVSMLQDGTQLPDERIGKTRLTIQGEKFTFDTGTDSHGGLYRIDPAKEPKELNIVIERGDEKGKVYLVIYKFEDGKMIQCMEVSNQHRPAKFTGEAGSGCLYEVWERLE